MSKIKNIIKKLLSITNYRYPICNSFLYDDIESSYCGGTLNQEKLCIVTNMQCQELTYLKQLLKTENVCYKIVSVFEDFEKGANEIPYDHIINIFQYSKKEPILEDISFIYKQLQYEGDYLIDYAKKGCCTTLLFSPDTITLESISSIVKGLGKAFGSHEVVCNGIVSNKTKEISNIFPIALYMNSKYGQILTGEVLEIME